MATLHRARPARRAPEFAPPMRAAVAGGAYVATPANEATVAGMVAQGFTRAQAEAIVANAKVSPDTLAAEAQARIERLKSAAGKAAVDEALKLGFTRTEAENLVASGRDIQAIAAGVKALADGKIDRAVVDLLIKQGLTRAEAEMLAATGQGSDRLLAIAKDPKALTALVRSIDGRLKAQGIDLTQRAAAGLGLSAADTKTIATAVSVAQHAYALFNTISRFTDDFRAVSYVASRWEESALGSDEQIMALSQALDSIAQQSAADRERRLLAYAEFMGSTANDVSAALATLGPWGIAAGLAVQVASRIIAAVYQPSVSAFDNEPMYKEPGQAAAQKLWDDWRMTPPSFDSTYFTLASFMDLNVSTLNQLDLSDAEKPWKDRFKGLLTWVLYPPLTDKGEDSAIPGTVVDLVTMGWLPFSFTDWMGSSLTPDSSRWRTPDYRSEGYSSGGSLPPELCVGGHGFGQTLIGGKFVSGAAVPDFVASARALTREARENILFSSCNTAQLQADPNRCYPDFPIRTRAMPRNEPIQRLICDRIAACLAILASSRASVPSEPVILAAVAASRAAISKYGWQPRHAAKRLRDTFLAIEKSVSEAGKSPYIEGTPVLALTGDGVRNFASLSAMPKNFTLAGK